MSEIEEARRYINAHHQERNSHYHNIPSDYMSASAKLATAMWMQRYGATEKSFGRVRAGLRRSLIADAYDLIKTSEKIGLGIDFHAES